MIKHDGEFKRFTYDHFIADSPFIPGTYAIALIRAEGHCNWLIAAGVISTKSQGDDGKDYRTALLVAETYYLKWLGRV
jgi:hypothetical protein